MQNPATQTVQFEGRPYQFPADATPEEIAKTLNDLHPAPHSDQSAATELLGGIGTGLKNDAQSVVGAAKYLSMLPSVVPPAVAMASQAMQGQSPISSDSMPARMLQGQIAPLKQAVGDYQQGHYGAMLGHGLAGLVPGIGPQISNHVDAVSGGQETLPHAVGEVVGSALPMAVAPGLRFAGRAAGPMGEAMTSAARTVAPPLATVSRMASEFSPLHPFRSTLGIVTRGLEHLSESPEKAAPVEPTPMPQGGGLRLGVAPEAPVASHAVETLPEVEGRFRPSLSKDVNELSGLSSGDMKAIQDIMNTAAEAGRKISVQEATQLMMNQRTGRQYAVHYLPKKLAKLPDVPEDYEPQVGPGVNPLLSAALLKRIGLGGQ